MTIRFTLLVLIASPVGAKADTRNDRDGFEKYVVPFLRAHCVSCHGPKKAEGKRTLHDLRPDDAAAWADVVERVKSGEMPPKGKPRPNTDEAAAFLAWAEARLTPPHGNAVEHRLLFDEPPPPASATAPRLWRFSPHLYRQAIDDLTGGPVLVKSREIKGVYSRSVESPLILGEGHGFRDYALKHGVAESVMEQLALNGRRTLELMIAPRTKTGMIVAEARNKDVLQVSGGKRVKEIADLTDAANPLDEMQVRSAVAFLFEKLLRRPPTDEEANRYVAYALQCVKRFGNRDGLIRGLTPVFLHPEALYRVELGKAGKDVPTPLEPNELADAIAYALTDKAPDAELTKAAREGRLRTRDEARRQVERLLNDAAVEKPRVLRFFQEYFGYVNASHVFKDSANLTKAGVPGKAYRPSELVEDTDLLVLHLVKQDKAILRNLLTTDLSFVASRYAGYWGFPYSLNDIKGCKKEDLFAFYSFTDAKAWTKEGPMKLPREERAGILTQPAWLVAHSNNEANNAILRGKWVRERLLGGVIPDVPVGVDAALPDEPKETLRHRMRVTREESCWRCHQKMDPLGLPFEQYDFVGRHRKQEQGKPVDTTGAITDSGDKALDGPIEGPLQMAKKLADSERVHQVFVRHAFRYWMGRDETRDDAATLQAAYKAYKDSDGSLRALLASLLTSDAFLYRTTTPAKGKP